MEQEIQQQASREQPHGEQPSRGLPPENFEQSQASPSNPSPSINLRVNHLQSEEATGSVRGRAAGQGGPPGGIVDYDNSRSGTREQPRANTNHTQFRIKTNFLPDFVSDTQTNNLGSRHMNRPSVPSGQQEDEEDAPDTSNRPESHPEGLDAPIRPDRSEERQSESSHREELPSGAIEANREQEREVASSKSGFFIKREQSSSKEKSQRNSAGVASSARGEFRAKDSQAAAGSDQNLVSPTSHKENPLADKASTGGEVQHGEDRHSDLNEDTLLFISPSSKLRSSRRAQQAEAFARSEKVQQASPAQDEDRGSRPRQEEGKGAALISSFSPEESSPREEPPILNRGDQTTAAANPASSSDPEENPHIRNHTPSSNLQAQSSSRELPGEEEEALINIQIGPTSPPVLEDLRKLKQPLDALRGDVKVPPHITYEKRIAEIQARDERDLRQSILNQMDSVNINEEIGNMLDAFYIHDRIEKLPALRGVRDSLEKVRIKIKEKGPTVYLEPVVRLLQQHRPKSGSSRPKSGSYRPKSGSYRPKSGSLRPKSGSRSGSRPVRQVRHQKQSSLDNMNGLWMQLKVPRKMNLTFRPFRPPPLEPAPPAHVSRNPPLGEKAASTENINRGSTLKEAKSHSKKTFRSSGKIHSRSPPVSGVARPKLKGFRPAASFRKNINIQLKQIVESADELEMIDTVTHRNSSKRVSLQQSKMASKDSLRRSAKIQIVESGQKSLESSSSKTKTLLKKKSRMPDTASHGGDNEQSSTLERPGSSTRQQEDPDEAGAISLMQRQSPEKTKLASSAAGLQPSKRPSFVPKINLTKLKSHLEVGGKATLSSFRSTNKSKTKRGEEQLTTSLRSSGMKQMQGSHIGSLPDSQVGSIPGSQITTTRHEGEMPTDRIIGAGLGVRRNTQLAQAYGCGHMNKFSKKSMVPNHFESRMSTIAPSVASTHLLSYRAHGLAGRPKQYQIQSNQPTGALDKKPRHNSQIRVRVTYQPTQSRLDLAFGGASSKFNFDQQSASMLQTSIMQTSLKQPSLQQASQQTAGLQQDSFRSWNKETKMTQQTTKGSPPKCLRKSLTNKQDMSAAYLQMSRIQSQLNDHPFVSRTNQLAKNSSIFDTAAAISTDKKPELDYSQESKILNTIKKLSRKYDIIDFQKQQKHAFGSTTRFMDYHLAKKKEAEGGNSTTPLHSTLITKGSEVRSFSGKRFSSTFQSSFKHRQEKRPPPSGEEHPNSLGASLTVIRDKSAGISGRKMSRRIREQQSAIGMTNRKFLAPLLASTVSLNEQQPAVGLSRKLEHRRPIIIRAKGGAVKVPHITHGTHRNGSPPKSQMNTRLPLEDESSRRTAHVISGISQVEGELKEIDNSTSRSRGSRLAEL